MLDPRLSRSQETMLDILPACCFLAEIPWTPTRRMGPNPIRPGTRVPLVIRACCPNWFYSYVINSGAIMREDFLIVSPISENWHADSFYSTQIRIGNHQMPLSEFLQFCAVNASDLDKSPDPNEKLDHACEIFIRGGLAALDAVTSAPWIQIGLSLPASRSRLVVLYKQIAELARKLLNSAEVEDFFFMHKPPGLRVRFHVAQQGCDDTALELRAAIAAWKRERLIERIVPGVYEPENRLFGGPISMRYVHRLFTIDSLAWLDYHAWASSQTRAPSAGWALSLTMLRALFDGLGVVGWEDLDVWDRIREQTGRRLEHALELSDFIQIATEIRACWQRPELLHERLTTREREIADAFRDTVLPVAADWREGYFATSAAYVGPRQAAAFATIFHWNRAALAMVRQALLTEALATEVGPE